MEIEKNSFWKRLLDIALKSPVRIILPECQDSRIKNASKKLCDLGFDVIDNSQLEEYRKKYVDLISKKKFTNNWSSNMINDFLDSNLNISLAALDNGDVDCIVAGATMPTSEVLRSSIRIVGVNKESKWISSAFFMMSPNNKRRYTYADCGVIPDPNSEQLCNIAFEASKLHKLLNNEEPNIAFLSFSTKNSAEHYKVKKVQQALKMFKEKYPFIKADGEIQFDVAINKDIYKKKVGLNKSDQDYNVFIFPDLDSGNIAYKITQHLANFKALGPLLMGLSKPIHDLSRGCNIDDIVYISIIAAIQKNINSQ